MEESPVRGPTLSTSTSSFEAMDPHDPNLSKLATKMFDKTEEYVSNELTSPIDDYQLLEEMSKLSLDKFKEMSETADSLATSTADLQEKFEKLKKQLGFVDRLEQALNTIEANAYRMDAYVGFLENTIKSAVLENLNKN